METQFSLPLQYDLAAVFLFALTGSLIALKRGYDPIGVSIITIISGTGGGIIRDAVFLNIEPSVVKDWRYSAVLLAAIGFVLLGRSILQTRPIAFIIMATEALGIGINSVYGSGRALGANTSIYAAIIIGLINAVGGRIMRDTVMGKKRKSLVPSRMYGVASFISIVVFLTMSQEFEISTIICAWTAIFCAFAIRMVAIKFDIKTKALVDYYDPSAALIHVVSDHVTPHLPTLTRWKLNKRNRRSNEDKPLE
ncbi:MAG: TRIC cation channel family protein [Acidimicrobiia bacterium]